MAGTVSKLKGATVKYRVVRRQGSGAATRELPVERQIAGREANDSQSTVCYDVVNNVDQGVGYTAQNIQAGAVGDKGGECTGNCAVGNAKRQLSDIANGVQSVSNAAGTGALTSSVTGAVSSAGNAIDGAESELGAELGTLESAGTADLGAEVGNTVGELTSGLTKSSSSSSSGSSSGSGKAPPPPPPHHRRQLNKIASGTQDVGNALGLGNVVAPVVNAEDQIDGIGTSGVGNLGKEAGQAIQDTLVKIGSSVPK